MLADRIPAIQSALADAGLDGWFFACFQQNDPIGMDLLGLTGKFVSRRCYYIVPAKGEPKKLVHSIESGMLDHLPGSKAVYHTWQKHGEEVGNLVSGFKRLAAQYSPNNELPTVSRLDAGTAELVRGFGVELVSSADLAQKFVATWTAEQLDGHRRANVHLHRIALEAFNYVGGHLRRGDLIDEYSVQRFIVDAFDHAGLWTESDPIVGVNAHAADPHYFPAAAGSSPILPGDFLLIDLWAKEKAPESVYADITWCGVCAASPADRHQEVFSIVAAARDAAWELVRSRYPGKPVRGFEVDDAAREVIRKAGYGDLFVHRTGHSIGISDHGQGANMDNLETHDTRQLLAMTGFSIEPGIYIQGDFGVRSEINVALTPEAAEITGGEPQRELLRLLA
ncbi:M24 family metallopeptidase [bacterium]|nr:MAG: M24 family metallopeptidase [bacterium]